MIFKGENRFFRFFSPFPFIFSIKIQTKWEHSGAPGKSPWNGPHYFFQVYSMNWHGEKMVQLNLRKLGANRSPYPAGSLTIINFGLDDNQHFVETMIFLLKRRLKPLEHFCWKWHKIRKILGCHSKTHPPVYLDTPCLLRNYFTRFGSSWPGLEITPKIHFGDPTRFGSSWTSLKITNKIQLDDPKFILLSWNKVMVPWNLYFAEIHYVPWNKVDHREIMLNFIPWLPMDIIEYCEVTKINMIFYHIRFFYKKLRNGFGSKSFLRAY